jgi:glycosyltransferase 2 family protein
MTHSRKRNLYVGLGIAISIVLLVLLFKDIEWRQLGKALSGANYWWIIPNIVLIILTMYLRAYRWHFMVLPIKKIAFPKLLAATCIGFMANNVLPLRLGEFVRAYSLSTQDKGITKSASLATIFVERMIFDLVALLLILGSVLAFASFTPDEAMKNGVLITVAVAFVGIAFITFLALRPEKVGTIMSRYLKFLPAKGRSVVKDVIVRFSFGLKFLSNPATVFSVTMQTILIWLILGYSNYFVLRAFGFDLPIDACFVLLVVVSISILVPSSPGFVGVYHYGAVWSLEYYGIPREDALSFAIVLHATQYFVVTAMGFYYLRKEHLSLKKLEEEATE